MHKSLKYYLLVSTLLPIFSRAEEENNASTRVSNPHITQATHQELESLSRPYLLNLPRCDLLATLSQLGVFIKKDDPQIFSNEMLVHLISFFSLTKPLMPVFLYASTESGPTLVKKEENAIENNAYHIRFSKNASENLELKAFSEQESVANKMGQAIVGEIEFNNTLYKQLSQLLLSKEELEKLITNGVEISLKPNTNNKLAKYTIDFKQLELVSLLKVFKDLPQHIRKKMAIKSIVRMKNGFVFPNETLAVAIYDTKNQEISLSDRAFSDTKSAPGEGTLIHELGHAYWATMDEAQKNTFIELSWNKDSSNQYQLKPGSIHMISDYSTKSPEEDFAEHFSGYVDTPEKLKKSSPEKHRYFQNLFFDTEYKTEAHEKAKLEIDSEKPDSTPPSWKWVPGYNKTKWWSFGLLNEHIPANLSMTCEPTKSFLSKKNTEATIKLKIGGVNDDISGVKSIYIALISDHKEKNYCSIYLDSGDCIDTKNGIYETSKTIELNDYAPGNYLLNDLVLQDRAGNTSSYNAKDLGIKIAIPGTKKNKGDFDLPELNFGKIEIKPLNLENGSAYELSIPVSMPKSSYFIQLNWKGRKTGYTFKHFFHGPTHLKYLTLNQDKTNLKIIFPNSIPMDDFDLSQIRISFDETEDKKSLTYNVEAEDQLTKISLPHKSGTPTDINSNIDLNSMKMTEIKQNNQRGGTSSIIVEVPIDGLISTKPKASFFMQAPSGKELDFFSPYTDSKIIEKDGKKILQSKLQLLPNHESGEYILKRIWVDEDPFQDKYFNAEVPESDDFRHLRIEASERGIIKKVIIEPSTPPTKPPSIP